MAPAEPGWDAGCRDTRLGNVDTPTPSPFNDKEHFTWSKSKGLNFLHSCYRAVVTSDEFGVGKQAADGC